MSKNKTPLDEFAKLLENPSHNLSVDVYNEDVKVIKEPSVKKRSNDKMTLAKLAKQMNDRFDRIDTRINNLEKDINARLDYIVKANNLKDSK